MKINILSIATLVLAVSFFACDQKKAQVTPTNNSSDKKESVQKDTQDDAGDAPADKPYQTVGYKKTACFGKCPVYEVKFFTNNTATWNGKMNVDRMGLYEARLEGKMIRSIRDKAHELGFFDLHPEYPIEHKVADLPSTITYVRIGDTEKIVKNTHEGPEKLAAFEAYIESIINKLNWQKTIAKD
ncbi:MAG: DUF6438 domain-containing protein [Bacteroidota bacterium]